MNKGLRIFIVTIVIMLFLIGIIALLFLEKQGIILAPSLRNLSHLHYPKCVEENKLSEDIYFASDDILITFQYSNMAWDFVQYGEIITKSGERYTYYCSNPDFDDLKECLTSELAPISMDDLNRLVDLDEKISSNLDVKGVANDFGQITIKYFGFGNEYILDGYGDSQFTNRSRGAREALSILRKYDIYI